MLSIELSGDKASLILATSSLFFDKSIYLCHVGDNAVFLFSFSVNSDFPTDSTIDVSLAFSMLL